MLRLNSITRLPAIRFKSSLLSAMRSVRPFSEASSIATSESSDNLEQQAAKIRETIEKARQSIADKTRAGLEISKSVAREVP